MKLVTVFDISNGFRKFGLKPYDKIWLDSRYPLFTRASAQRFPAQLMAYRDQVSAVVLSPYPEYMADRNDCDDFAIINMAAARLMHIFSGGQGGCPVGTLIYTPRDSQGDDHMVNILAVEEGDRVVPWFLDNNLNIITLTKEEMDEDCKTQIF